MPRIPNNATCQGCQIIGRRMYDAAANKLLFPLLLLFDRPKRGMSPKYRTANQEFQIIDQYYTYTVEKKQAGYGGGAKGEQVNAPCALRKQLPWFTTLAATNDWENFGSTLLAFYHERKMFSAQLEHCRKPDLLFICLELRDSDNSVVVRGTSRILTTKTFYVFYTTRIKNEYFYLRLR